MAEHADALIRSVVKAQNKSKQVRMVKVKLPDDKGRCFIRNCCHLVNGRLVIADSTNRRMKIVDLSNGKVTKYWDTDEEPTSVCCIGPQEFAVVFFPSSNVHVYSAVSLIWSRTIILGHSTSYIACHDGLLYCASGNTESILYVHDVSDGRKLREICAKDIYRRYVSMELTDIAVNGSGDRHYVADRRGLICINTDGRRIFLLSQKDLGLSEASGVTTDHHGHVFVSGWESQNVVKVTEGSRVVEEILSWKDGIECPHCLSYDVSRSQLCVGGESDHILMVEWK